ncbi:phage tail protein [Candidimonas humi]|uniref:Phage tail protein n=1 Tax=Candidimonas humi TaxID=683355 RepID=A0ABV8NWM4_9BURK|nr:phage tail protein [Candidimonas humi]MBV6304937.1 phage tail protein [Candidimonas humi]
MSTIFADGSVVGFATVAGTAVPFSAITNAKPPIADITGDLDEGDVIAISSNNGALNRRPTVAGTVDSSGAELLGLDTTNTTLYPASGITGSLVAWSDFVDFSQQGDLAISGGEPQTYTGKYLEDPFGQEFAIPIGATARQYTLPLDYDDTLPWYAAAITATAERKPRVIRIKLPNGDMYYEYGYLHFNPSPALSSGNPAKNTATLLVFNERGTLIKAGA